MVDKRANHAAGLAGKLRTGITLALIAASVTALAVLRVAYKYQHPRPVTRARATGAADNPHSLCVRVRMRPALCLRGLETAMQTSRTAAADRRPTSALGGSNEGREMA